ncbi:phosphonate metabolism protein/1,5-bisphosphokinase (PRPP-forming) PhnN [Trinickia caryophylli]|uniref:Ribose 1,5-bisphosphate phosphokinase PhnN n=1 Tax=Trinickia caryophylli TaxID=28094 RepID=A0A1X7DIA0_TRICW|nr:phosphonate metabolism protein/1,5-bisphosphokinase (PRPP-forming) PhnN [Trinickia caryophylli]PMS12321.1 phosphonate metabolism protein/1,5-bisphosphokinase (PRPP-forming) PhnN [Trinickia caryophylli]TRX17006.1 phosphonate metabolism protein/1,5-bisphosphokinase (PRPP-forming) PhnN [Trinickia caryophylli]WQE12254.1 phosphonate metabolism protein/1,5-bisphosphokinase (PRPP-forming) PhnN [Trinickia caryophylli]SMF15679.1 ribose 1,5-bisphosphokinase [Trinickia caryophylli]GLU31604.1 ribose 1,
MNGERLVYVMGPSGAGKDTLLEHVRAYTPAPRVLFAHRYITRARNHHENHIELSEVEFEARSALGLFALEWSSHALRYGIGIEIDAWMDRACMVVVNGSRAYLPEALARYPRMAVVHVTAEPPVLARRLAARGRETVDQIQARLARSVPWAVPPGATLTTIDNSGALDDSAAVFLDLLRRLA